MSNTLLQAPAELIRANYYIWKFTDQIYKVVYFPNGAPIGCRGDRKKQNHYDRKLDSSISRSRRRILELGLCNDWKFFCTFTIAADKYDRTDLHAWQKSLSQWLRDQRKKYSKKGLDISFEYAMIPELHADEKSWHMHGFFSDISPLLVSFADLRAAGEYVPDYLVDGGYFNWVDYQKKFGFCSFGVIRNKVAAGFYVTKYLSKSLGSSGLDVGDHSVYASSGLNRSVFHGDIYGHSGYLDKFLKNHYEFCHTGMTHIEDGLSWDFALELMDVQPLEVFPDPTAEDEASVDRYYNATQMALDGF